MSIGDKYTIPQNYSIDRTIEYRIRKIEVQKSLTILDEHNKRDIPLNKSTSINGIPKKFPIPTISRAKQLQIDERQRINLVPKSKTNETRNDATDLPRQRLLPSGREEEEYTYDTLPPSEKKRINLYPKESREKSEAWHRFPTPINRSPLIFKI